MARASDIKSFADLGRAIGAMDLVQPPVVILSGDDADLFDLALAKVRERLSKAGEQVETTILSGEQGDEGRLFADLLNMPLFAPYRLFVVRQANEVLRASTASRGKRAAANIPERTLLLLDWRGKAPAALAKLFGSPTLHLVSRDLYENRVQETMLASERRFGLDLADEARHLLQESIEHREGAVEKAYERLKERLPAERHKSVSVEDVREILLPDVGFHIFELVDAIYARDFTVVERELARFDPHADNFFAVLKVMLSRADELRRSALCRQMGMSEGQLVEQIGIKNRPPFIQKRILARIRQELTIYGATELLRIYALLIELQREFRSRVPLQRQPLIFAERVREVFMAD